MNMPGMSQRWVNVDLLTTEYRIVGRTLVGNAGLFGLLIDSSKSFIEIRQAQIAYLRQPTRIVRRFDAANLLKDKIYVALIDGLEFAGAPSIAHRGYASFQNYPLHISFTGFELDCYIEWTGRFEMASLLVDKMGGFMLVYDAYLDSSIIPGLNVNTPAAMVNMSRVDLIALAPKEELTEADPG
ncbi:MAG TPA: hypothetical protein VGJ97_02240 [Anaerolineaceae bacterium]|jgi:hypothetical protein